MGRLIHSLSAYLKHRFSVQSKFSLHSPFIYKFWSGILKDRSALNAYREVEKIRKEMLSDKRVIKHTDLGAGADGKSIAAEEVRISRLASKSLVSPAEGQFLYRLAKVNQPEYILELGTSFGISTLYLSEGAPASSIITIEGCPETAAVAQASFEIAGKKNIRLLQGGFDERLDEALSLMPRIDLVFFDGNHRKEPTLEYFEKCLSRFTPVTIAVLDDIHWSPEMEEAWKIIIAKPEVRVSIDLFHLGVIYFREELSKEDFVLRF